MCLIAKILIVKAVQIVTAAQTLAIAEEVRGILAVLEAVTLRVQMAVETVEVVAEATDKSL